MDKENAYLISEIYFIHKEEQSYIVRREMDTFGEDHIKQIRQSQEVKCYIFSHLSVLHFL